MAVLFVASPVFNEGKPLLSVWWLLFLACFGTFLVAVGNLFSLVALLWQPLSRLVHTLSNRSPWQADAQASQGGGVSLVSISASTDSDAIGAGWRNKAAEEGPVCAEDEDEIYCTTYQDVEASGLIWEEISFEKTRDGTEICNTQLVDALKEKLVFDKEEWVALGVRNVTLVSYVQVGDKYFKPATAATGSNRQ